MRQTPITIVNGNRVEPVRRTRYRSADASAQRQMRLATLKAFPLANELYRRVTTARPAAGRALVPSARAE